MILEDHEDGIHLTQFDGACCEQARELLLASRTTKLKVTQEK